MNKREIPLSTYNQEAASEFLGERFFSHPTYPSQLLGRLLQDGSVPRADIEARFAEVMEARGEELSKINVGQNVRHSRDRMRRTLGRDALIEEGGDFELDWEKMPKLDTGFYENVVQRSVQRHGFDVNRAAANEYGDDLCEEFGIPDPLQATMLKLLIRLQGLPYFFNGRDREVSDARRLAIQAMRRRLDTFNEAKGLPKKELHPIGARGAYYFARSHIVNRTPDRIPSHLIEHTHNQRFGREVLPNEQLMALQKPERENPLAPIQRALEAFTSVPEPVSP